jgi:hypothetical protein
MDDKDKLLCDLLEKWGFESGNIRLPVLDVTLELGEGRLFKNLGIVDDIQGVVDELSQYGELTTDDADYGLVGGLHVGLSIGDVKASVIAAEKHHPPVSLYYLGHEATHASVHLVGENFLRGLLELKLFDINPFEKGEEYAACIGGVFGLYGQGKLEELKRIEREHGPTNLTGYINDLMGSRNNNLEL